jgi:hypothetical protein
VAPAIHSANGGGIELLNLAVADLTLALDARAAGIHMAAPECYRSFMASGPPVHLNLRVSDGQLSQLGGWQSVFYDANTWQLWRDGAGHQVFVSPKNSAVHRQIAIDENYREGVLIGQLGASRSAAAPLWPLKDMDVALYANWLAEYGDLILHACGVTVAGEAYAFVGPAGAGKSTLASALSVAGGIAVLGEDTVVARRIEGRFVLFGTPWHTDPARCAPGGVPLHKVFFLDRTVKPGVCPIQPLEAIQRVLQNALIPYYNRAGVARIMDALVRMADETPFFSLSYRLGSDVLGLIRGA